MTICTWIGSNSSSQLVAVFAVRLFSDSASESDFDFDVTSPSTDSFNDSAQSTSPVFTGSESLLHTKLQSVCHYYNQLLTCQLEQQYDFFQGKIREEQMTAQERTEKLQQEYQQLQEENTTLQSAIETHEQQTRSLEKQLSSQLNKVSAVRKENQFLHDLNLSLLNKDEKKSKPTTPNKQTTTPTSKPTVAQLRLTKALEDRQKRIINLKKQIDECMKFMEEQTAKEQKQKEKQAQREKQKEQQLDGAANEETKQTQQTA